MFDINFICLVLYPVIIQSPKNVITPLSSTATFTCVGQGYGFVSVTWKRRNTAKAIPRKSKINNTYTLNHYIVSTLTIPSVRTRDKGIYQCVYVNSKGPAYSNFAILQIGSKDYHTVC